MNRPSAPVSLQQRMAWGEVLLTLSIEAGQAIEAVRRRDGRAHRLKSDDSPVTQADLAANEILLKGLARLAPAIEVLSEEAHNPFRTGHPPAHAPAHYWAVDPLDGTREFLARKDEFTVNIALVRDGVPVVGTVYAPAHDRLWIGGRKAFEMRATPGQPMPARDLWRPAHIRASRSAARALVSRSHLLPEVHSFLARGPVAESVPMGSSLKFCIIASGEADMAPRFGPTMEWDTAAGDAVLRAAGGQTLGLDGRLLTYGHEASGFRNGNFVAIGDPTLAVTFGILQIH